MFTGFIILFKLRLVKQRRIEQILLSKYLLLLLLLLFHLHFACSTFRPIIAAAEWALKLIHRRCYLPFLCLFLLLFTHRHQLLACLGILPERCHIQEGKARRCASNFVFACRRNRSRLDWWLLDCHHTFLTFALDEFFNVRNYYVYWRIGGGCDIIWLIIGWRYWLYWWWRLVSNHQHLLVLKPPQSLFGFESFLYIHSTHIFV